MPLDIGLSEENENSHFTFKPVYADHWNARYLFVSLDGFTTIHLFLVGQNFTARVNFMPHLDGGLVPTEFLVKCLKEHFPSRSTSIIEVDGQDIYGRVI